MTDRLQASVGEVIKSIDDLQPDPRNANVGSVRGHAIIENSVRQRGAGRSGLAAADGTMIAGSQTLQKMAELGMEILPVHTRGDQWVVVVRDDIEPGSEAATLLALEDNRATDVGLVWDAGVLASLSADMDLSSLFYPEEMTAILEQAGTVLLSTDDSPIHSPKLCTCPECGHVFPPSS